MKKVKLLFLFLVAVLLVGQKVDVKAEEGNVITVSESEGSDIAKPLIKALEEAAERAESEGVAYTVKVSPGEYKLGRTLHIYGNTTLDVTGVIFNYTKKSGNMLMNGSNEFNMTDEAAGYGKDKNMTILGGEWVYPDENTSCIMRFVHCSNLTLKDCVITGGNSTHQVEVGAIDGFYVENCTFKDMKKSNANGGREALQLDIPICKSVFPYAYSDGTLMKNVRISGCTFKNVPRGVGSHNVLVNGYFDNIEIVNNTFENIEGDAIITANYINSKIDNNTMTDCGSGVLFTLYKSDIKAVYSTIFDGTVKYEGIVVHDVNTSVSNNVYTMRKKSYASELCAFKFAGYKQLKRVTKKVEGNSTVINKGNYYISGLKVNNNQIKTNGFGIHFMNVRDSEISGNTINCNSKSKKYDGISTEKESLNNDITNNTINNSGRDGIAVKVNSSAKNLTGNTIKNSKKYGFFIYDKGKVLGDFSGNLVEGCKSDGIEINLNSSVRLCEKNIVKKCKEIAIYVGPGSSAKLGQNSLIKNKINNYVLSSKKAYIIARNFEPTKIKNATTKKKKLTLEWKEVKGATDYSVEYSLDKEFTNYKTIQTKKTKINIKKLKSGTTYYIRIRANATNEKRVVYGKYSKIKIVKIK